MGKKITILTHDDAVKALAELVDRGLAHKGNGTKWRLTWAGQDEGLKLWERLDNPEKILLLGMVKAIKGDNNKEGVES